MLASGNKLRILGKGDADPYPDAVTIEARELLPSEEGREAVLESNGAKARKRKPKPKK